MTIAGISFRATSGYVTDNAGDTYSLGEAYPTTRGGLTFGFDTNNTANTRNRNSSAGYERIAGMAFGTSRVFEVDLPAAGTYDLYLGIGDDGSAWSVNMDIKDNTTTLFNVTASASAGNIADANGTVTTDTGWISASSGRGVKRTVTFASTKLKIAYAATGFSIAHVAWEGVGATVNAGIGNAVAAGAQASISSVGGSTINASVGNAVAAGAAATLSNFTAGTITTDPLVNNTGTVLANETGLTVAVLTALTGTLVVTKTNQTTNASGVMSINDPLIAAGTAYKVVYYLSASRSNVQSSTAA